MAEAFICALNASGLQNMGKRKREFGAFDFLRSFYMSPGDILVNDVNESRLTELRESYGVKTTLDVNETVEGADMVILACKPQNVTYIAKAITSPVTGESIQLSHA